jgi:predicted DNA-binding transcriptional regulator AlpA
MSNETPNYGEALVRSVRKRLLNVEETAHYLGIAPRTIYNRIGRKAKKPFPIKPERRFGKILFDQKKLDAFIESEK